MQKIRVGITIGDINGIGPEVIIKALNHPKMLEYCTPVVYGSAKAMSYHKNIVKLNDFNFNSVHNTERLSANRVNVLNCWEETVNITLGRATEEGGKFAHIALDRAVRDLKEGHIDLIVTGPVNKHAMQLVNFPSAGHTEYLESELGGKALMIMVSDTMRIGLVTGHIPISEIPVRFNKELLDEAVDKFIKSLQRDFGIDKPKIAVLGLNPHASDDGLIGDDEENVIRPVIVERKKAGHLIMGPYSADGFFGSGMYTKFDGILAMYHDQGLIPFKALSFGQGVNFTAGLPFVRTSPDHGTAYDLTGKNEADPSSFRKALFLAIDVFKHRNHAAEVEASAIKKEPESSEDMESIN